MRRRPRLKKRRLLIPITLLIILCGAGLGYTRVNKKKTITSDSARGSQTGPQQVPAATSNPQTIRFIATGDFIAHDAINNAAKKSDGTYDYLQFMTAMQPFFTKADIRFCNQAVPSGGAAFGISGYPVFNSPLEVVRDMAKLGCNVINTGTNHTNDKGQGVINAELGEWDKQTGMLAVAGANRSSDEQNKISYFTVKGVKFAFLSFSTYSNAPNPNSFSLNRFDEPLVTTQMQAARAQADVVIVSMRWGTEYSPAVNAAQEQNAQKLSNLGADVILGHGPHVLEPVKRLQSKDGRETLVWYSLGNFLNAQLETESLTGCLAVMDIDTTTKKLTNTACLPIYMHYEWTAAQKAKEDLLARHNFQLLPLDQASSLLAQSQLHTDVAAQKQRIKNVINTYIPVPLIGPDEY